VDAPVDGMPVADQGENEQQNGDQEQSGGFRGVDMMAVMLRFGCA
jgi:hypothetical protein